LLAAGNTRLN